MTCDAESDIVHMRKGNEEPTGLAWYKGTGVLRDFTVGGPYVWTITIAKDSGDPTLLTFHGEIVAVQTAVPNVTLVWPDNAFATLAVGVPYSVHVDVDTGTAGDLGFKEFILLLDPAHT